MTTAATGLGFSTPKLAEANSLNDHVEVRTCVHNFLVYWYTQLFLADSTNGRGRAIGTVLRPSVCRLSVSTECVVAKRCVLQKLQIEVAIESL